MPLIPVPSDHPQADPVQPLSKTFPAPGVWTPWYSVRDALHAGMLPTPALAGAYVFRLDPDLGTVPDDAPTRLIHIGGMGDSGSIFQRVGNFIAAGLGVGETPSPQSQGGFNFGALRTGWGVTILDVHFAFVIAPDNYHHYCAEVETWRWYWDTYLPGFPTLARADNYPVCDKNGRNACTRGKIYRHQHPWFTPPPSP